ncbi:hypothetical protein NC653_019496 [Populus alba x Populus x berolinensis]|uniref:Uncharacterized protein n=1 Tax=Populus alba x Populus x berolinensis TaxID=444605 RepID=A0AAD6QJ03_9ROSI|nr:hypothetical protein NC653_019496 [Populus alba x Populus x berolinensis]
MSCSRLTSDQPSTSALISELLSRVSIVTVIEDQRDGMGLKETNGVSIVLKRQEMLEVINPGQVGFEGLLRDEDGSWNAGFVGKLWLNCGLWFRRVGFCLEEGFPQGIDSISDSQAKYCFSWIK